MNGTNVLNRITCTNVDIVVQVAFKTYSNHLLAIFTTMFQTKASWMSVFVLSSGKKKKTGTAVAELPVV